MYAHLLLLLPLLCTRYRLLIVALEQALLAEQAKVVQLLDFLATSQFDSFLALHSSLVTSQVDYPKGHKKSEEGAEDDGEYHEA